MLKRKIGYSSLGRDGKIRLSAIIDFMQDSSDFHLKSLDFLQEYFRNNNMGMYVVSRQLDFLRLPGYGEELCLNTFTHECKNMYGYRNTLIYGNDGDLCVRANTIGAFMDLETSKPVKITQEILSQVQLEPKIDMEYLPRKVKPPDKEPERLSGLTVRKYHLDSNLHINNAKFIDIAQEFIPDEYDGRNIKRLMVEYRTPASLGDVIMPERYVCGNNVIIKLSGENTLQNTTYAVAEFMY